MSAVGTSISRVSIVSSSGNAGIARAVQAVPRTRWSVSTLILTQVGHNRVLMEFSLGNPAKAFVLATKTKNLKNDHKSAST